MFGDGHARPDRQLLLPPVRQGVSPRGQPVHAVQHLACPLHRQHALLRQRRAAGGPAQQRVAQPPLKRPQGAGGVGLRDPRRPGR
ncbi:hypothetical protein ACFFX0_19290 [Citricoccus parietis]|uniref:Uncharacterized protein n=1 Tax=Citricoccus parietis TaxID=592307 RepID=A0ABV5G2R5_9MICC